MNACDRRRVAATRSAPWAGAIAGATDEDADTAMMENPFIAT